MLFIGPPGVGKTHLAIALGQLAIDAGHRVYYTTAADLAARCQRAAVEGRWATTMRFLAAPQLLIVDELGYLPLPPEAAAALFQVVARRYLSAPTPRLPSAKTRLWKPRKRAGRVVSGPRHPARFSRFQNGGHLDAGSEVRSAVRQLFLVC